MCKIVLRISICLFPLLFVIYDLGSINSDKNMCLAILISVFLVQVFFMANYAHKVSITL